MKLDYLLSTFRITLLVCISSLQFLSVGTIGATWAPMARFALAPAWYGPETVTAGVALWGALTDYEAASWSLGVDKYSFRSETTYVYGTTTCVRKYFRTPTYQDSYTTTWTHPNGLVEIDQFPFDFFPEKRYYSCGPSGSPPMSQLIITDTQYWLRHHVTHWPVSSAHLSPSSGIANIKWVYNSLPSSCSGSQQTGSGLGATTSKTYIKDAEVVGISIPASDAEVTSVQGGKSL